MRRRRAWKDNTAPRDVDICVMPPQIAQMKAGEQEFVDRLPLEVKVIAWEKGVMAARAAYQSWRAARVRGKKWDGETDIIHNTLLGGSNGRR